MQAFSAPTTVRRTVAFAVTTFILAILFAVAAQAAQPTQTTHVPLAVSTGRAIMVSHMPANQVVSLAISLPLLNESALDDLLAQIYDRTSSSYHHYLSVSEFTERFGPSNSDYASLLEFAQSHGLTIVGTYPNRRVLDVEGPAASIESAFHISLDLYQHPTEARTFYAPDREPSLDLAIPVLHITGLDNYTLPHPKNIAQALAEGTHKTTGSGPGGDFIGSDLRAAYYGSGSLNGSGQVVGLFEFAGYELSDVKTYFHKLNQPFNIPVKGVSLNGVSISCPPRSCDDSEQALDIEIAAAMAPGLKQIIVYVGSKDVSIYNRMATDNVAKQTSCSWGWADDESSLDPIFKQMSAQGQTNFVATGDQGSSTTASTVWPSDDPYVVAVGGTDLTTTGPGGAWSSETGWSGSAGMPSKNNVPIPSYQQIAGVVTSQNGASSTLRNIPDVAAEANTNQYSCYDGSCSGGNGGTSYASPQWAAILAMANEQSIANGGTTLGFINPSLYRIGTGSNYAADFHDITSGSNGKYTAVTGYDLVTGWGSPIAGSLIDQLLGQ